MLYAMLKVLFSVLTPVMSIWTVTYIINLIRNACMFRRVTIELETERERNKYWNRS